MRIVITGSPGTGKSSLSKLLSKKLGLELIDIKKIAKGSRLVGKNHEVDIGKLAKKLSFVKKKKNYVIEGHLACEMRLPADFVFVLRTNPKILKKRLTRRNYPIKKLEENLMAEMLDYCSQRVLKMYRKKPVEIDTSKRSPTGSMAVMEKAIKQRKKIDNVDYSHLLKQYLIKGRFQ